MNEDDMIDLEDADFDKEENEICVILFITVIICLTALVIAMSYLKSLQ